MEPRTASPRQVRIANWVPKLQLLKRICESFPAVWQFVRGEMIKDEATGQPCYDWMNSRCPWHMFVT
jgi:hypothetical protein